MTGLVPSYFTATSTNKSWSYQLERFFKYICLIWSLNFFVIILAGFILCDNLIFNTDKITRRKNFPHPGHIACCSAPNSRPPATKALHTIYGNNTSILSNSWWWAYKCPKHVEQIISAIWLSVTSSWLYSVRLIASICYTYSLIAVARGEVSFNDNFANPLEMFAFISM